MSLFANVATIANANATDGARPRSETLDEICHLVVSRHSRLRLLIRLHAPDIVVRNERRMLQAAVGAVVERCGPADIASPDEALEPRGRFERNAIAALDGAVRADRLQSAGART